MVKSAYEMLEGDRRSAVIGECSNGGVWDGYGVKHGSYQLWEKWSILFGVLIMRPCLRITSFTEGRFGHLPSAICSICLQEDETTMHILWQCAMARNIWALVPRCMQKLPNYGGDYSLFMWSIWNARNHFVHDEIQSDPLVIKNGALSLQRDFKMAKSSLNPPEPVG